MIVYIISQKPGKYKTNFIKPSQRKTDILYREFAAKSHFILEMLADLLNSGCKKAHPCFRMSSFAHEARYRLCGAGRLSAVKENSRRRKCPTPGISLKTRRKRFHEPERRRIPFCNYIVTLCVGFCKSFL